ncbi:uncharacterized protein LOC144003204 [Festucalex cinctus]
MLACCAGGDMKWLLVVATTMTCVAARPPQRLTRDTETQQLPNENKPHFVFNENVNQSLADSARISSNLTSQDTPNLVSNVTSSNMSNLTSEDTANVEPNSLNLTLSNDADVRSSIITCSFSTFPITDLSSKLQTGDEMLGGAAIDPDGFGKK